MIFIGRDANFTDGTDPSQMSLIYELFGKQVRIPADTATEDIEEAVYTAAGYTTGDITTVADINPQQVTNALAAIATMIADITTDEGVNATDTAALPAATNAQTKEIVGRMLEREADELQRHQDTLVLVRKIIKFCALLLPPQA
jgi:hypothetical protein